MTTLNGCPVSGTSCIYSEDENQLQDSEVFAAEYMLKAGVSNFRNAWESPESDLERVDEYSLGVRERLQDAVLAATTILGMQTCEMLSRAMRGPILACSLKYL